MVLWSLAGSLAAPDFCVATKNTGGTDISKAGEFPFGGNVRLSCRTYNIHSDFNRLSAYSKSFPASCIQHNEGVLSGVTGICDLTTALKYDKLSGSGMGKWIPDRRRKPFVPDCRVGFQGFFPHRSWEGAA